MSKNVKSNDQFDFEVATKELDQIVEWFQDENQFKLDQAIDKCNQAKELLKQVERHLFEVKNQLIEGSELED